MEKFRIGSLDYSPYNNHNKEHLIFLNDLNELLLYMGVKDSFRRLGYASKITSELTDYILKKFAIKGIKVQVESYNIGSLKAIQKSWFEHLEDNFYIKR